MKASLSDLEFHLPEKVLTNEDLQREFPSWSVEKIYKKTGIAQRHIAAEDETAGDLAVAAAEGIFKKGTCSRRDVDFLILCTQSPDYLLPTTACLVQSLLGLSKSTGALDFNLGCSGFVYGLSLAKGLIESGQARNVLLLCADTYSKFLEKDDRSVRTLFGDAGSAALIKGVESSEECMGPFVFGTDGLGKNNLIVPNSGLRRDEEEIEGRLSSGIGHTGESCLRMNGPEIFNFTLNIVPDTVARLLSRAGLSLDDVALVVMHQANRYMLEHLRKRLAISKEKFMYSMENTGNTVSSTIPIALVEAERSGRLASGDLVMLVGFGVGYSWGATVVRWP